MALLDAIEKIIEERGRDVAAADLRHWIVRRRIRGQSLRGAADAVGAGAELATGAAVEATGVTDEAGSAAAAGSFEQDAIEREMGTTRDGMSRDEIIKRTVRKPKPAINGKERACGAS